MKINSDEIMIGINIDNTQYNLQEELKIRQRIDWLTRHYLVKMFETLVDVLYKDPEDQRLWEFTYPNGYANGWGVPQLKVINDIEANQKYIIDKIESFETAIDSNVESSELNIQIKDRIFRLAHNYLEKIFDAGVEEGLYKDPKDHRLWELIVYSNEKGTGKINFQLIFISDENARKKYRVEEIRKEELIIDCNFNSKEDRVRTGNRIYQLTHNYLDKIFDAGWEVLYKDPKDHRFWELTYPNSREHGGGLPLLRYLSNKEVVDKYKITL